MVIMAGFIDAAFRLSIAANAGSKGMNSGLRDKSV